MNLYPTPENPLPEAAVCVAIRTRDGIRLRAMRAGVPGPRGTVVILGGRGDFMERYFETMRDLIARGFCVASVDLRGQGGSQRSLTDRYRGHVANFSEFDEDLTALMRKLVLTSCPPPYYAIGHSTGGNILLRILREQRWFSKAVLASPLIGIVYDPWPRPIAAMLVAVVNFIGLGWMFLPGVNRKPMMRQDFPGNPLTSCEWRWSRDSGILDAAPQLGLGGPTYAWLRAARQSIAKLTKPKRHNTFKAPVLIVASGDDKVVSNRAIRDLAKKLPGAALVFVPGARHELLTEADHYRRQFFAAFDSFIEG